MSSPTAQLNHALFILGLCIYLLIRCLQCLFLHDCVLLNFDIFSKNPFHMIELAPFVGPSSWSEPDKDYLVSAMLVLVLYCFVKEKIALYCIDMLWATFQHMCESICQQTAISLVS